MKDDAMQCYAPGEAHYVCEQDGDVVHGVHVEGAEYGPDVALARFRQVDIKSIF
jgi:hypothetical protein